MDWHYQTTNFTNLGIDHQKYMLPSQKKFYILRLTSSSIAFSPHHFAIYHCHHRTKKRRHNRRRDDCRRIGTPILAAIRDDIHWYQLQRRDIHHKKRTHLITRSPRPTIHETICGCHPHLCIHILSIPALPFQLLQIVHRPKPPLSQGSDTYFLKKIMK